MAEEPAGTLAFKRLTMRTGRIGVSAPKVRVNGKVYGARVSRARFTLRKGRTVRVRVAYVELRVARRLRVTTLNAQQVALTWESPGGRPVRLRRRDGDRAPATVGAGTAVSTKAPRRSTRRSGPAPPTPTGCSPRRPGGGSSPTTVTIGTPNGAPDRAAYAAPAATVIVNPGDADRPAAARAAASMSRSRPAGRHRSSERASYYPSLPSCLPDISARSPPYRPMAAWCDCQPAGLADAFDFYDVNVDLGDIAPITMTPRAATRHGPRALNPALKQCIGGSADANVVLHPILKPKGHFQTSLVKKFLGIPVGVTWNVSAQLEVGLAADIQSTVALTCGLQYNPVIKTIVLTPVPIAIAFDPIAEVSIASQFTARNVGYSATGGFWNNGEIGLHNFANGGLIKNAGPTDAQFAGAVPVSLSLGGELTVGPGGGVAEAGIIAGVGGKLIPDQGQLRTGDRSRLVLADDRSGSKAS